MNLIFLSIPWVKSAGKAGMLTEQAFEGANAERDDCPIRGRPDMAVSTDGRVEHDKGVFFGTKKP